MSSPASVPPPVTLARHAMATRFEVVLHGASPVALRAAGEEALGEVERVEAQLSLYRNSSEIARVNARAALEPVRVSPPVFRLLEQALALSRATGGAFDITVAPLVRAWGFMGGTGRRPDPESIERARELVGFGQVLLDPAERTVRFARDGVMVDLGAIGKGYALERTVELLLDAGVTSALIHGGTSTVCAIGTPPDAAGWKVAIETPVPPAAPAAPAGAPAAGEAAPGKSLLATVCLKDESLSVSAVWGRSFAEGGRTFGHVLDPRTGQPVAHALLSAVVLPSATETDALSTALLTLGWPGVDLLRQLRPSARALVVRGENGVLDSRSFGFPEAMASLLPNR